MQFRDYYEIMGVARDASQDEIKRAYRKLARKFHPDVSKEADAEQRFKELGEAYEVLKDPEKRAAYDQLGADYKAGQEFRPPPDWNEGFEFHGGGFTGGDASQFSDFFESLFGGRGFARQGAGYRDVHMRGQDSHARVLIDIEDAYRGTQRAISLQHVEVDPQGRPQPKTRTLKVTIPKGISAGQQIRLAGQGSLGVGGAKPGDLFLEVDFRDHPLYRVDGKDVYLELPVAPWEAALGATVKVPTPAGAVEMKIPAGSASGRRMRLKGRGLPARQPGDLYVVLKIVIPEASGEEQRQAWQQLAKKFDFDPRASMVDK